MTTEKCYRCNQVVPRGYLKEISIKKLDLILKVLICKNCRKILLEEKKGDKK